MQEALEQANKTRKLTYEESKDKQKDMIRQDKQKEIKHDYGEDELGDPEEDDDSTGVKDLLVPEIELLLSLGKKLGKCGSNTHLHTRHRECPLNGELACETAEDDFHVDNSCQCQGPNLAPYRVD